MDLRRNGSKRRPLQPKEALYFHDPLCRSGDDDHPFPAVRRDSFLDRLTVLIRELILKIALKIIQIQEKEFEYKTEILKELIFDYLLDSKSIVLEGIVNFRINPVRL